MPKFVESLRTHRFTAVAIIVVLLVLLFSSSKSKPAEAPASPAAGSQPTATSTPQVQIAPASTTPIVAPHAPAKTKGAYGLTVDEYVNSGYRFQFSDCAASPGYFSVKKGTQVMLDNRDANPHVIKVGSQSFHVGSYGYAVVTAKDLGNLQVTCDGGGAARLIVAP